MAAVLKIRVGQITETHAHLTLFDRGGHAGAIILDRATWDSLGEATMFAGEGDLIQAELAVGSKLEDAPRGSAPRRTTRGDE